MDEDARHFQERVQAEEDERRRKTVNVARFTVQEAGPYPVVPEAKQRPLDPDHFAGKVVVGAVTAITLAVALSSRSASLTVVAVEIVAGLLVVSDAWGLRSRLPWINSESRVQATVGWIALALLALTLRQIAALWS